MAAATGNPRSPIISDHHAAADFSSVQQDLLMQPANLFVSDRAVPVQLLTQAQTSRDNALRTSTVPQIKN